jgi:hypothetical protein
MQCYGRFVGDQLATPSLRDFLERGARVHSASVESAAIGQRRNRVLREGERKVPAPGRKPSDGLEPSTPSLPWNDLGNWSQPTATLLACLGGFHGDAICDRLPPVATTGLHKGSILSCQMWIHPPCRLLVAEAQTAERRPAEEKQRSRPASMTRHACEPAMRARQPLYEVSYLRTLWADRGPVSERAVWSAFVVVLEPVWQRLVALAV